MKKKNIIFVCTGNTCRSPMAEIILKNKLKLVGVDNIKVSSAGLSATAGEKISRNSLLALKQLGYKAYAFKSKPLTHKAILKADLVLCMTASHKTWLKGYDNVFTIAEVTGLGDINDPYGGDLSIYIKTSHQLEDACNVILNKILIDEGE